jgi:hypothetical protein
MQSIANQSFTDKTLDVDGKVFVRCTFERCRLVFHGTDVFSHTDCRIGDSCTFVLEDAAARTIRQLREIRNAGGTFGEAAAHYLSGPDDGTTLGH